MIVYSLSKEKYCKDLSEYRGSGARLYGGRWNPKGVSLLYTAESRALAAMELAVRLDVSDLPEDLVLVVLEVARGRKKDLITEIKNEDLPGDWDCYPNKLSSQRIGEKFVNEGKYLAIKVPSVSIKGDFNYLINPFHVEFNKYVKIITVELFSYEPRLRKP
ncbi:RES family NAD+ phosphorylase [Catalinimonas sp. 4WD22]|uniref:RES family NAD+ phosphorylase n=1 Tax=Catalinimonas locisalis TaxID=3133978 RepID=UPI003101B033